MEKFDDDEEESEVLSHTIRTRRLAKAEPLKVEFFKRDDTTQKRIILKGSVLDYCPDTRRFLIEEGNADRTMYFSRRLCIQFRDLETKGDIDERRVKNMNTSKQALLRVNLERMLLNEALKQRPELRMSSKMVNRIEKLIDLPRVAQLKKEPLDADRVR